MAGRTKIPIFSLCVIVIAACSSQTATKPEISSSSKPAGSSAGSTDKSAASSRQNQTASSLNTHREGKSPATGPLKEIRFDFDSYDLTAEARSILQANATWLKANPSASVEIEGHCDERGTTEYNLALGAKRARTAMEYLLSLV